jgi:AcrR family transcriptional regulator
VVTAERLFAEHGVDNVSLRQVATAAGYANPATVQYHFGSKEGLCEAIIEHRLPAIDLRRSELLDQTAADDLPGLVEAMARPLLEHDPESNYIGFLSRFLVTIDQHERAYHAAMRLEGGQRLRAAIDVALGGVAPDVRRYRLNFATVLMVHAIAERRWRAASGRRLGLPTGAFERELLVSLTAVLRPGP